MKPALFFLLTLASVPTFAGTAFSCYSIGNSKAELGKNIVYSVERSISKISYGAGGRSTINLYTDNGIDAASPTHAVYNFNFDQQDETFSEALYKKDCALLLPGHWDRDSALPSTAELVIRCKDGASTYACAKIKKF